MTRMSTPDDDYEHLPRDERARLLFITTESGPRPLTSAALRERVRAWPVTSTTPPAAADLLRTARAMTTLGTVHYDLFTAAVAWSLLAVEAAFNVLYPTEAKRSPSLGEHVKRARADGLLDERWAEQLKAATQLRDGFAHPRAETRMLPAMTLPLVEASHQVVAALFPEAPASPEL